MKSMNKEMLKKTDPEEAVEYPLPSPGWYIVKTNHRQERRAKFYLEHSGFSVYFPLKLAKRPRDDLLQHHPLFPSYLFLQIPETQAQWHKVFSMEGVESVLCTKEGRPHRLRDGVVEELKAREVGGLISITRRKQTPKAPDWARPGQKVEVRFAEQRHPLHPGGGSLVATICEEPLDANRIRILFQLFERDQRVVVALDGVSPL